LKKYIIEYTAGTKGDLLCRFLNNFEPKFIGNNRTHPADVDYINWLKIADPRMLTLDRFEEVLYKNKDKYLPAHCLWVTIDKDYVNLLKSYNYEVIKLLFEPKHFVTISIESIMKNQLQDVLPNQIIDLINCVWFRGLNWNTFTLGKLNSLDVQLTRELAWKSRAEVYKLFIENCNDNKTLINYDDLYVNFNSDLLKDYDLDKWKILVEKSWCVFDGTGRQRNFFAGYRDFVEYGKIDEITKTRYGNVISSYLKSHIHGEALVDQ